LNARSGLPASWAANAAAVDLAGAMAGTVRVGSAGDFIGNGAAGRRHVDVKRDRRVPVTESSGARVARAIGLL